MVIDQRINAARGLLDMVKKYSDLIAANDFLAATVTDMQENAKDTCNLIKAEIDDIKTEINGWS